MEAADLVVINTLRDPRGRRGQGHRAAGAPGPAQGGEPGMRVVLTGCAVRESRTAPASHAGIPPWTCSSAPTRSPSWLPVWASPAPPPRACSHVLQNRASWPYRHVHPPPSRPLHPPTTLRHGTRTRPPQTHFRPSVRTPCRGTRVARGVGPQRLAADHLRLRQDLHLLHRAVQPRAGAEPSIRRHRRRGAAAWPPPVTAKSRCSVRTSTPTATTCRPSRASPTSGARAELGRRNSTCDGRPDIAELLRAIDAIRDAGRQPAIPRLRFITSHPWDLSRPPHRGDGRVPRPSASISTCPSSQAPTPSYDGWAGSTLSPPT